MYAMYTLEYHIFILYMMLFKQRRIYLHITFRQKRQFWLCNDLKAKSNSLYRQRKSCTTLYWIRGKNTAKRATNPTNPTVPWIVPLWKTCPLASSDYIAYNLASGISSVTEI